MSIKVEKVLKAISNFTRLRIVSFIIDKNVCGVSVETALKISQINVSKHINILVDSGILNAEKQAQRIHYTVNKEMAELFPDLLRFIKSQRSAIPALLEDQRNFMENGSCMCKTIKNCDCRKSASKLLLGSKP